MTIKNNFSLSQSKVKQKANSSQSSIKQKRKFVKVKFRESDLKKTINNDFLVGVNKFANLKWQVLNNLQLLDSVGLAYRESSYNAISNTRKELKEKYGLGYSSTLVGTEDYQVFNFNSLQVLGAKRRNIKGKPPKNGKLDKDQFLFTISRTDLNGSTTGNFEIRTKVFIDNYIDLNRVEDRRITYRGGTQSVAGVILWDKYFEPNVFPITTESGHTFYFYRLKTSPNSPINWVNVERLKSLGIYKPNKSFNHSYYEPKIGTGAFESSLSSYAYANVGYVITKVFTKYSGSQLSNKFSETFNLSLNNKIKNVMKGKAIAYNISKNKGK